MPFRGLLHILLHILPNILLHDVLCEAHWWDGRMSILLRNRMQYLVRRTPARYARVDSRSVVWLSLGTDSKREATVRATVVWDLMLDVWEARLLADEKTAQKLLHLVNAVTRQHRR